MLAIIEQGYGPHNCAEKVCFSATNEAVIFVKLSNGMNTLLANLSDLAARRANGTIASDDELKTKWLRLKK